MTPARVLAAATAAATALLLAGLAAVHERRVCRWANDTDDADTGRMGGRAFYGRWP